MYRVETFGNLDNTSLVDTQIVSSNWFARYCCCGDDKRMLCFPKEGRYHFQIVAIKHQSFADDYVIMNITKGGIGENYVELEIIGNIRSVVEVYKADNQGYQQQ